MAAPSLIDPVQSAAALWLVTMLLDQAKAGGIDERALGLAMITTGADALATAGGIEPTIAVLEGQRQALELQIMTTEGSA